jgi:hypothetical protein
VSPPPVITAPGDAKKKSKKKGKEDAASEKAKEKENGEPSRLRLGDLFAPLSQLFVPTVNPRNENWKLLGSVLREILRFLSSPSLHIAPSPSISVPPALPPGYSLRLISGLGRVLLSLKSDFIDCFTDIHHHLVSPLTLPPTLQVLFSC